MEIQKRKKDWTTMLIPFAIVIALMAVFMIAPEESKSVVDTMRGFFGDTIGIYYIQYLLLVVLFVRFTLL